MLKIHCFIFISCVILKVLAVPPGICNIPFRWDDCGKPPKAVMYYWKEGSRCEIGMWKGCLPNLNMFNDEYECINTCMFVDRADKFTFPRNDTTASTEDDNSTDSSGSATVNGTDANGTNADGNNADVTNADGSDADGADASTAGTETADENGATTSDQSSSNSSDAAASSGVTDDETTATT